MPLFKWRRQRAQIPAPSKSWLPINHGITLDLWRGRVDYVKWARDLFKSREGSDLLSVVRNEMPVAARGDDPAYALGRISGYMEAINVLTMTACYPPRPPEEVPITYEPDIPPPDNDFEAAEPTQ